MQSADMYHRSTKYSVVSVKTIREYHARLPVDALYPVHIITMAFGIDLLINRCCHYSCNLSPISVVLLSIKPSSFHTVLSCSDYFWELQPRDILHSPAWPPSAKRKYFQGPSDHTYSARCPSTTGNAVVWQETHSLIALPRMSTLTTFRLLRRSKSGTGLRATTFWEEYEFIITMDLLPLSAVALATENDMSSNLSKGNTLPACHKVKVPLRILATAYGLALSGSGQIGTGLGKLIHRNICTT